MLRVLLVTRLSFFVRTSAKAGDAAAETRPVKAAAPPRRRNRRRGSIIYAALAYLGVQWGQMPCTWMQDSAALPHFQITIAKVRVCSQQKREFGAIFRVRFGSRSARTSLTKS